MTVNCVGVVFKQKSESVFNIRSKFLQRQKCLDETRILEKLMIQIIYVFPLIMLKRQRDSRNYWSTINMNSLICLNMTKMFFLDSNFTSHTFEIYFKPH